VQVKGEWDRAVAEGIMTYPRDYPVECRSLVTKAMLTGGKLAEVLCSLWNSFVIKLENNPSGRFRIDGNIKLYEIKSSSGDSAVCVDSRKRCA